MRRNELGERPTRREDLVGWYEGLLERHAESGLSVAEFAARAGVSAWTLYQWRRRLSEGMEPQAGLPRLVEVSVVPAAEARSSRLAVELRSGRRIEVGGGFDGHELKRLIGVLESC
jgi:hypothetical protein